jgi:SAM-dependent methyltransferase
MDGGDLVQFGASLASRPMNDHAPHQHSHGRAHGHPHDRGARAVLRYLRLLPRLWTSEVNREVVRLLAPARGERVVDLGAGAGAATIEAARSGATVVAVEPMPYMRGILRLRRAWQPHRSAIRVVEGGAEHIPLEDGSVDALWTVNTIHHWTERDAASRELARVMKPGGRVLLLDEDFDDASHPEHRRVHEGRQRHRLHFEEVDPERIADALRRAGFAESRGARKTVAGRPAKVIEATR